MKIPSIAFMLASAVSGGFVSRSFEPVEPFTRTYNSHFSVDVGQFPALVSTADFDQDGYDDIAVKYWDVDSGAELRIYLNQSGTGFLHVGTLTNSAFYDDITSVGTADVNGDGFPDIILTNHFGDDSLGDGFRVWMNQLADSNMCAADIDKSGSVNFSDLLFVLNEWGQCEEEIN